MSEPDKTTNWDLLASELGAEPSSAEPPPPPQAPAPVPQVKREPKSAPEPPPAAADWNSLASLLGITPPPEETADQTPAKAVPAGRDAAPAQNAPKPDLPSFKLEAEPPRRDSAKLPDDLLPRRIEPSAADKAVGDLFGVPTSARDVAPAEERSTRRVDDQFSDEVELESDSFDEDSASEFPPRANTTDEDAESEGEGPPKRRRRRRRRGRRGKGERETLGMDSSSQQSGYPLEEGGETFDLLDEIEQPKLLSEVPSASEDEDSEDGEEAKPSRRRRRRRGRRGRRKEGAESSKEDAAANAPDADFDEDDQFDSPNDIPMGGHSGDDDEEEETSRDRAGHRNIPTWDEAIGIMISVNMEARAKSPGGNRSGPPRGRGRGGRGKRS